MQANRRSQCHAKIGRDIDQLRTTVDGRLNHRTEIIAVLSIDKLQNIHPFTDWRKRWIRSRLDRQFQSTLAVSVSRNDLVSDVFVDLRPTNLLVLPCGGILSRQSTLGDRRRIPGRVNSQTIQTTIALNRRVLQIAACQRRIQQHDHRVRPFTDDRGHRIQRLQTSNRHDIALIAKPNDALSLQRQVFKRHRVFLITNRYARLESVDPDLLH